MGGQRGGVEGLKNGCSGKGWMESDGRRWRKGGKRRGGGGK